MSGIDERISVDEYRALVARSASQGSGAHAPRKTKGRGRTSPALRIPKPKRDDAPASILMRLMRRLSTGSLRLQPEERLSIEFADALRAAVIDGSLRAVWTHPANEVAGRHSGLSKIRYTIAKTMGMIDGAADYLFLWGDGSGALEAKIGSNRQQDNQLDFEWWCRRSGVHYEIFTSVEQGLAILAKWGVLTGAGSAGENEDEGHANTAPAGATDARGA